MKPSLVIPLLTLFVGFAGGWLAKPTPAASEVAPSKSSSPRPLTNRPATAEVNPSPLGPLPGPGGISRNPGAEISPPPTEAAAESRNAAKLQRFIEAIGLSETQQADLTKLIAETAAAYTASDSDSPRSAQETLDHLAACSAKLEKSLGTLLTPEQAAKFAELRQRELGNRIESRANRELGRLSEITDLSATQRDQILTQLRQSSAAEVNAIPPSYALMLNSSVLPLGQHALPEQAVLTLTALATNATDADPSAGHDKIIADQRKKIEERINWLKPILTPAQLAQYQAAAAEQRAIHDVIKPH